MTGTRCDGFTLERVLHHKQGSGQASGDTPHRRGL
ncbi:unnamed protein product [Discosporangium mesarthrocarpum]